MGPGAELLALSKYKTNVRFKRSQDPRLSRGLGIALEGHDTDNAPKGATNGSANCIADSWRAPEGAFLYALVFLLPVNGSMNSFKLI